MKRVKTPRIALVVQARTGSTRLPGKSMLDLAGEPLVGRILERLQRCTTVDEVVLAIPTTQENDDLVEVADKWGATCVRGSEDDVLSRFLDAIAQCDANIVVRFPGDNPIPEPNEIDRIITHHLGLQRPGFSTNICSVFNSGYPDGIGAEVIDSSLIIEAAARNPTKAKTEHVHLNFFDYASECIVDKIWCPVSTIDCPPKIRRPDLRLDVNTQDDYDFMRRIYEDLYPSNPHFSIGNIIAWADTNVVRS